MPDNYILQTVGTLTILFSEWNMNLEKQTFLPPLTCCISSWCTGIYVLHVDDNTKSPEEAEDDDDDDDDDDIVVGSHVSLHTPRPSPKKGKVTSL